MAFPNASNTLYRLCWDSLSIAISVNSLEEKKEQLVNLILYLLSFSFIYMLQSCITLVKSIVSVCITVDMISMKYESKEGSLNLSLQRDVVIALTSKIALTISLYSIAFFTCR